MKKILQIFLCLPYFLFSQDNLIDSLNTALKSAKHDTTRAITLIALSENLYSSNPDTVIPLCKKALVIIEKNLLTATYKVKQSLIKAKSSAVNNLGFIYSEKGEVEMALKYLMESLKISEELKDYKSIALAYRNMAGIYKNKGDIKKCIDYAFKSLSFYEKVNYKEGIANELNDIGWYYSTILGDAEKSITYYTRSLKLYKELKDFRGVSVILNNLGFICVNQGNIKKGFEYYKESLIICEKLGDKKLIAFALNNLGMLFSDQKDYSKAFEYLNRSLKIRQEIEDKIGLALAYSNIGELYSSIGNYKSELEYAFKSLSIRTSIGDKDGMHISYNNLGIIYFKRLNNYAQALIYLNKGLEIAKELNHNEGIVNLKTNISLIYLQQKKLKEALKYAVEAYMLSKKIGYPKSIKNVTIVLKDIYVALNKPEKALEMFELHVRMKDSLNNIETQKSTLRSQYKYEYEKKLIADSIRVADDKKVVIIQLKQEKTQRYALYGGISLVLIFGVFTFNRLRITQSQKQVIELKEKETFKQNELITLQKNLVEQKHKEITDSINYAERIQKSFLATKSHLDNYLSDYFIFFQPKDVVSGDFYWSADLKNGEFVFVTADSTGHGVPGAIMSLLNITTLEKVIETFKEPSDILNATRKIIIERLKKDGSTEGGKDGMDCSIIILNKEKTKLTYAAANNPVWIIRDNTIIELPADKMPIGKHDKQDISFNQRDFLLQKGDVIYTLTDGFPDQFGGPKGKKFMYKQLENLLISISNKTMHEQKELLDETFLQWKGNLEQVDDVTVVGIRI